jgi:hypothetical protein
MYKQLPLRPNVKPTEQLQTLIAPSHCWHFDAWLLRDASGALYLRIETRMGGRYLLTSHDYIVEHGRARMVMGIPADARPITLQDKAEWPHTDTLNRLHRRYVLPMAARVPDGFRSRSVALHYVRAPDLAPFDGSEVNLHQYGAN